MPTTKDRLVAAGIGVGLLVGGIALALVGYAIFPQNQASWTAVGAGFLVLTGFTAALASVFLYLLPAILPVR